MKKIFKKILDIILFPFSVIAVIFAGIAIASNFIFTPKFFQKLTELFPQLFSKKLFIILLLILILVVGGYFAWQYFGMPEEVVPEKEVKVPEEETVNLVKNLPEVKEWLALFTGPGGTDPTTGGKPVIEFSHMEGDIYVIHVYESLLTHTATFNWYYVNFQTGEIRDFFGEVVSDETAGWKIYTGAGFAIKYPQNWKVAIEKSINLIYLTPEDKRTPENIWVYISVSKKEDLAAQPFYNPMNFFGKPQPFPQKVKINEKEFYKSEERFEGVRDIVYAIANKDESEIGWITLSIRYGRQRMDYYIPDEEVKPELQIFNQMLSTFKFLE